MQPDFTPNLVGEGGLEPPRPFEHWNLNPARLPIPPLARVEPPSYNLTPFARNGAQVLAIDSPQAPLTGRVCVWECGSSRSASGVSWMAR